MSDKTFLQQLESIRQKVAIAHDHFLDTEITNDTYDVELQLNVILQDIQHMINQCIEIQLHIMKEENAKNHYKKKDI